MVEDFVPVAAVCIGETVNLYYKRGHPPRAYNEAITDTHGGRIVAGTANGSTTNRPLVLGIYLVH